MHFFVQVIVSIRADNMVWFFLSLDRDWETDYLAQDELEFSELDINYLDVNFL